MKLTFRNPYLSIKDFPSIELPELVIVLGPNGAGKSHLLAAIKDHFIDNTVAPGIEMPGAGLAGAARPMRANQDILLIAGGSGVSSSAVSQPYNSSIRPSSSSGMVLSFDDAREQILARVNDRLRSALGEGVRVLDAEDPWRLGVDELVIRLSDSGYSEPEGIREIFQEAENLIVADDTAPRHDRRLGTVKQDIRHVSEILGIKPLKVTADDVNMHAHWGILTQFQPNMSLVFGKYRDAVLNNKLRKLSDGENNSKTALSDDDFRRTFGDAPWKLLDETLEAFGLPYQSNRPQPNDYSSFEFKFRHRNTGDTITEQNLSSGEKILFKFAISLFSYNENFVGINRPKLLLLDEVDSSLHPQMVKRWLSVISDGLVKKYGINCVLSTHSPTTVALSPDVSLYEMTDGVNGLKKIDKQSAINKLTFGVPTLSIDYAGRRQVIVESNTDASLYEKIYSMTKSHMKLERQLNFISSGIRNKKGQERNGGCSVVTRIVSKFHEAGAPSV